MDTQKSDTSRKSKHFVDKPFKYHQIVTIKIETITNQGIGLGRIDNWVVFVPFTLPGELVEAKIYANKKNYSEADLVKIIKKSKHRIEPKCIYFGKCGGCQYQNLDYKTQLYWKKKQVEEIFEKLIKYKLEVKKIFPSPMEFGYRSKLTPHFKRPNKDGKIESVGFLRADSRSKLIDIDKCIIANHEINDLFQKEKIKLQQTDYSNNIGKKKLRGGTFLFRSSQSKKINDENGQYIRKAFSGTNNVCREKVLNINFKFSSGSFFQTNPFLLNDFAKHINDLVKKSKCEYLIDTYCGCGFFGLINASIVKKVMGIESDFESIEFAKKNASENKISNAEFINTDSAAIFKSLDENEFNNTNTLVVIDPPRRGCSDIFLNKLKQFKPSYIIYVSCYPATLARDLNDLITFGYSIDDLVIFDMFPQTKHVECVTFLRL